MTEHSDRTSNADRRDIRARRIATVVSILTILVVFSPVVENWQDRPDDGFPLSHYPMFTAERGDRLRVNYLVGYTAAGERRLIRYRHAGTGGLNQVRRQINTRVRRGEADTLCESAKSSIARSGARRDAGIVRLDVVTGTYLFDEYFGGQQQPHEEDVQATCVVERSES